MSSQRMIHDSLFDNEAFQRLRPEHQVALIACLVCTDDWGRGRAGTLTTKGKIPLEGADEAKVALHATGIVRFYGSGQSFFYAPKFFTYQELYRPRRSIIPLPVDDDFLADYLASCEPASKAVEVDREQARERWRRGRRGSDLIGEETPMPTVLHDGVSLQSPPDLPTRLREEWCEIARGHGTATALRALDAARRLFGNPTEKQLRATFQAAHDAGAVAKPQAEWPDFRKKIARERANERGNTGAGGTDPERQSQYTGLTRKIAP